MNSHRKPYYDAIIYNLWRFRSPDYAKFPVVFPVSREFGARDRFDIDQNSLFHRNNSLFRCVGNSHRKPCYEAIICRLWRSQSPDNGKFSVLFPVSMEFGTPETGSISTTSATNAFKRLADYVCERWTAGGIIYAPPIR
jgi:hypothetical protein